MSQNMRKKGSKYKGYIIKIEIKAFMIETTKLETDSFSEQNKI